MKKIYTSTWFWSVCLVLIIFVILAIAGSLGQSVFSQIVGYSSYILSPILIGYLFKKTNKVSMDVSQKKNVVNQFFIIIGLLMIISVWKSSPAWIPLAIVLFIAGYVVYGFIMNKLIEVGERFVN